MQKIKFTLVFSLLVFGLLTFASESFAAILFSSNWNTATGSSENAIEDGGKWNYGRSTPNPSATYPYVIAGTPSDPGGYNYLRMTSVGGGYAGPYYYNIFGCKTLNCNTSYSAIFGNPDNLYIRFYFKVSNNWQVQGPTKHWFQDNDAADNMDPDYLCFNVPGENECITEALKGDYALEIQHDNSNIRYQANVHMLRNVWYRYEVYIQKVTGGERWTMRLDGVDITDKFYCVAGNCPSGSYACTANLKAWFDAGGTWSRYVHQMPFMTSYDMPNISNGWDVSAVEIRDDTWPGPVGTAPPDTTPPTVSMTAPVNGATVSGTAVTVSANASDNVGVVGVQFKLDGVNMGSEDASSPYSIIWNTTQTTNGSHTLTAVARDAANNQTTSSSVSVTVNNDITPPAAPTGVRVS